MNYPSEEARLEHAISCDLKRSLNSLRRDRGSRTWLFVVGPSGDVPNPLYPISFLVRQVDQLLTLSNYQGGSDEQPRLTSDERKSAVVREACDVIWALELVALATDLNEGIVKPLAEAIYEAYANHELRSAMAPSTADASELIERRCHVLHRALDDMVRREARPADLVERLVDVATALGFLIANQTIDLEDLIREVLSRASEVSNPRRRSDILSLPDRLFRMTLLFSDKSGSYHRLLAALKKFIDYDLVLSDSACKIPGSLAEALIIFQADRIPPNWEPRLKSELGDSILEVKEFATITRHEAGLHLRDQELLRRRRTPRIWWLYAEPTKPFIRQSRDILAGHFDCAFGDWDDHFDRTKSTAENLDTLKASGDGIVLVLAGDPRQGNGEGASRNMYEEIGEFRGLVKEGRALILHERGVAMPSNVGDLIYTTYTPGNDLEVAFRVATHFQLLWRRGEQ